MSAATPGNITKSFANSGVSLRREERRVFCGATPESIRLYGDWPGAAGEMFQRYEAMAEEAREAAIGEVDPEVEVTVNMEQYEESVLEIIQAREAEIIQAQEAQNFLTDSEVEIDDE
jgi:hypothetical protein